MKVALWFLALLNALAFAAQYYLPPRQPEPQVFALPPPATGQKLVLLSESQALTPDAASASTICYSLGPFLTSDQVAHGEQRYQTLAMQTARREVEERVVVGYRVYLPGFKSEAAARRKMAAIQAKGVVDMSVVELESAKNYGVLFGVFGARAAAEARQKALQALGFQAKLEERTEPKTSFRLDVVDTQGGVITARVFEELLKLFPQLRKEPKDCQ